MEINDKDLMKKWLYRAYLVGFFIILALPVLTVPPYFFPPDWGKTIIFRSIMAIMLFLFAYQFLYKKNEIPPTNIKSNKIILPLAAFFVIFLLASIFSVDPYFSFWGSPYRGGGFVTFALYFIFALLTFILFKREDWKRALDFSIVIGILVSLVAAIQYYGLFNRIFLSVPDRPPSTMGNPDFLALYLLLLSFITLSYAIKDTALWKKIFYFSSLLVFMYTILITGSRAVYFAILAGGIYFLFFLPKKIKAVKITVLCLLILAAGFVLYANTVNQYPKFLEDNRLFKLVESRLSLKVLAEDARFSAWHIELNILKSKPLLGYGPENFAVGFDKYYDPLLPNIKSEGIWWDKAHNIILQTGAEAGVLGIIAYLALFTVLFWQLQKNKRAEGNKDTEIIIHGLQATLIGYLTANLFGFDSFSTYLIFFLLIAYSMHLTARNEAQTGAQKNIEQKTLRQTRGKLAWWRPAVIFALFILLALFLWQYNFVPFKINTEINQAGDLANQKQCDRALNLMDKVLTGHSFLDSYARLEYVEFTKTCANFYPENNLAYFKKDAELINEAVKIQPLYTRYWMFLGSSSVTLASQEKNIDAKNNLIKLAGGYFDKALQLAPKHQEILVERAKLEIIAGDYEKTKNYSGECIALNPALGDCYFYLALSDIYLKNTADADKNMQISGSKGYNINSKESLDQLSNAYASVPDYKNLATVFEKLIQINPTFAQYHSSLAFFYKQLGKYSEAKQEALTVLQLSPESKPNVDAFLKTLPK